MSGHSKWATTKRQKAVVDAKRGAIFTKLANTITIAVKERGGDPAANFSLRMAIDKAKAANMPKDNIERAIKRGTGELVGEQIDELIYEGIGPIKSQFIIKSLTDNKNRSAASIRHIFTKYGGSFGSVKWNFTQKGVIQILKFNTEILDLELELIDAGADDILNEKEKTVIYTKVEDLQNVKNFLDEKNITTDMVDIEYVAKERIKLKNKDDKEKINKFITEMENCEDVSNYYTNIDL